MSSTELERILWAAMGKLKSGVPVQGENSVLEYLKEELNTANIGYDSDFLTKYQEAQTEAVTHTASAQAKQAERTCSVEITQPPCLAARSSSVRSDSSH